MNIYEKLLRVQSELHAPKGQYNSFGKYKYRSCEDILEAVKPLLAKYNLMMMIHDNIRQQEGRYYVEAEVRIFNADKPEETITNVAYARESENKTGMDSAQVTGTSSSYARKYALNGLFLIDDTKDPDTNEYHTTTTKPVQQPTTTADKAKQAMAKATAKPKADLATRKAAMAKHFKQLNVTEEQACKRVGASDIATMTEEQVQELATIVGAITKGLSTVEDEFQNA